ncbi:hypothetical protein [Kribbella sp. C-35]|uniref:hypothetical protein n=1 Tax=Kribbella sp. C-35 TaxID=2789276 RepID=UPI00397DF96F
MDENQRAEFERQEAARQAHHDALGHERVCPSCSGPSPAGGNCPGCVAALTAAERTATNFWLQDSFTSVDDKPEATNDDEVADEITADYQAPPDHHIFPQQFRDRFEAEGLEIDIDLYTTTMYEFQHQILHTEGWNAEWKLFFDMFDEAEVDPDFDDVVGYATFLMDKYGFGDAVLHPYRDQEGHLGPHIL